MTRNDFRVFYKPFILCNVLILLLFTTLGGGEAVGQTPVRESVVIRNSPYRFQITVPGNVDESRFLWPNFPGKTAYYSSVRIRNEGKKNVVNPRLILNGFQMPLTTKELIRALTHDSPDDLDRILRVFYEMTHYVSHQVLPATDPIYPLGFFLNYCYGVCFNQRGINAQLYDIMRLPWRVADPMNHATIEVENPYKKQTMLLDTDLNAYYLKHDNWNIASARDVQEDPMLILRSTHEREYHRSPWQEGDPIVDMWGSSEKMAALYGAAPPRPLEMTKTGPHLNENFSIILRPGESYGWHSDQNRYHESLKENPILNVSRQLVWETDLDLSKSHHRWFIKGSHIWKSVSAAQHVTIDSNHPWMIPYRLLFPVLGMDLFLRLDSDSENMARKGSLVLSIALKTPAKTVVEEVPLAKLIDRSYSLDRLLQKLPYPLRNMDVLISIKSPVNNSGISLNIKGLQIRLFCQSTAFACRSPQSGHNNIIYTDASKDRHVRIEIETQPATVQLPLFSKGVFSPGGGKEVAESALRFVWPALPDSGAAGYQWQVSAHRDMRYPLSPTFERLVDGTFLRHENGNVFFQLPWRGMLPIGKELFWRVRPYDSNNLAGDWSPVKSFKIRGPGVPQNVRLVTKNGNNILMWDRNPQGTAPVKYEIHTSSLEGFMPTDRRHRILGMSSSEVMKYQWTDVYASDWPMVPPTLLTTTDQMEWIVFGKNGPQKILPSKLGAHYRIIAIDEEKSRSCPSPQIHLPHPQIVSPIKVVLPPGAIRWQVPVISSLGRVTARVPDYRLRLWDKSTLVYFLPDIPNGVKDWTIDRNTGILYGNLVRGQAVPLTVEVHDTKYGIKNVKKIVFEGK
ncbi:MAG: hypothetical protein R6V76_12240 [Desulfobacterales bacterium]